MVTTRTPLDSSLVRRRLTPSIGFPELVINPLVDVAASVAEMLSDPEPGWALVVVAPCVDGGDRHPEVAGEVFNGEQPIDAFHNPILRFDG